MKTVVAEAAAEIAPIDAAALARRIAELPALPLALSEAMRALGRDDLPASACARAIELDLALAARVLRLANSPFYGVPGRIGSVSDAVRLLGLRTVAGVVAAVSLRGLMQGLRCPGFHFEAHWRHVLATAIAARELALCCGHDADEAFLAGLLHDVGQLVLARFHPQRAARALALARDDDVELLAAERQEFGRGHDAIGAEVARHWGLPGRLWQAIETHHAPEAVVAGESAPLGALVHVADAIAHALDVGGDAFDAVPPIQDDAWDAVRADDATMLRVFARVEAGLAAFEPL